MAPASPGAVSMTSVFLLLSSCSKRSLSYLLWFWLLVRVPDSRSMERASPGDSRFCPQSLEASRSKSASPWDRRMKDLTLKLNLWFDLRCFVFRPPPKPPDFSRRSSVVVPCGSLFFTESIEARRRFFPFVRAWLPNRVVVDIATGEQPVMRAENPRIQVAVSDQGALPVLLSRVLDMLMPTTRTMVAFPLCCMMLVSRLFCWIDYGQVTVPFLTDDHSGGARVCFTALDCDFMGQSFFVAPLRFVVGAMMPIYVVCLDCF